MMRFSIVKNSGTNQPSQLSYDFSPPGGTIGRSTDNNWVLPDEELAIARLQIVVSISSDGGCQINNQGHASEVLLNMIPLAPERQVEIRDGDMLNISSYQIKITDIEKNSHPQSNDKKSEIPNGIWDDLEQIFAVPNTLSSQERHHSPQKLNDNNPLVKEQQNKERNPIDPLAQIKPETDLETLQLRSTDPMTMFNSDTTVQQENILHNHTPTTLLQRDRKHENQEDDKKEIDPLVLFSEKHTQYVKDDDPLNQMLDNAVPPTPLNDPTISELLFTPEPQSAPASQSTLTEPGPIESVAGRTPGSKANRHHNSHNYQATGTQSEEKLLAALLDGMGLKDLQRLQFDERLMYQLGRFASQLSQGIITLNTLRNQFKRKSDADMNEALSDVYNPFKLLPSGQSVLALIFGGYVPGFMPSEEATQDILTELQAHQLGMIAGIHAIAADLLHSFNPVILEQTAGDKSYLPRLSLSSAYKASMWDYFTKYYQNIAGQIEKKSALFGESFLQAYEAEISRYKNTHNSPQK
ncbi:type VI secretion system-associated FHA domain protein TagH [Xenorhabdus koppenhoeferi]|uniref:FHA domain protein n=1 Tax=Xenorhabdus koppenhoeferi TaxID=351659 RepID=A0A1I7IKW1_9GAMM|nr:type VI secretion system-associated FHA domain protein TagH [Xenorhabdus koppenhoeferi]SFU73581.1 FHA domain protein [Xenorhabdus koppenhoeferi]